MITFNKIVNKLGKLEGKVLSIFDIGDIIDPDFSKGNKKHIQEIYKIIYRLKSNNIITTLKNGLYFVSLDSKIREVDIIDSHYWDIIFKIIRDETDGLYFIGGNKALELHLKDYGIQNKLIVYTKDVQKNININSSLKIQFKIFVPGKNTKKFSFNSINKYTTKLSVNNINFSVAGEELALLDSLLLADNELGIDNYLILKYLKKFEKYLSRDKLGEIVRIKYISAINRLRIIAQNNKLEELYQICLDIIKKEGANCFLSIR